MLLLAYFSHYFFGFSICILSIFLILLVLVQRGRGGGLTGALGGPGGQSAFGTKAGDLFTRITIGVATVWIFLCGLAVFTLREGDLPDTGGALTSGINPSVVAKGGLGDASTPASGSTSTPPPSSALDASAAKTKEPATNSIPPAPPGNTSAEPSTPSSKESQPPVSATPNASEPTPKAVDSSQVPAIPAAEQPNTPTTPQKNADK